jgi:hypothetical protein
MEEVGLEALKAEVVTLLPFLTVLLRVLLPPQETELARLIFLMVRVLILVRVIPMALTAARPVREIVVAVAATIITTFLAYKRVL